ncbi:hypothetical protein ACFLYF_02915 [Chloroflexota bacterium]
MEVERNVVQFSVYSIIKFEGGGEALTLAIAVRYPFVRSRQALESLATIRPISFKEAIVFLTDSRWTYSDHCDDYGLKIHDIDISTMVAYSGKVNIAEHCIKNLKSRISNPRYRRIDERGIFQRTYKFHKRNNDETGIDTGTVSFILGKYLRDGKTKLIHLESPDFKPMNVDDIVGIGDDEAYKIVISEAVPKLNILNITNSVYGDCFSIAATISDAMLKLAIDNSTHETVGGLIQYRVLCIDGNAECELSHTQDPTGRNDAWHKATATRNELHTLEEKHKLGPDFLMK